MPTNDLHTALADQWGVHRKHWVRVMEMLEQHPAWVEEADEVSRCPICAQPKRRPRSVHSPPKPFAVVCQSVFWLSELLSPSATVLTHQTPAVPLQYGYLPAHLVSAFGGRREVVHRIISMYPEAATMLNQACCTRRLARSPEMTRFLLTAVLCRASLPGQLASPTFCSVLGQQGRR